MEKCCFGEKTSNVSAIILAAGDGKRMKSSVPKVFHTIGGLPIFGHIINTLCKLGISNKIVVLKNYSSLNCLPEKFKKEVTVAIQDEPKGTANAAQCAVNLIEDSCKWIFVLYGDIPFISKETLNSAVEIVKNTKNTGCLVLSGKNLGQHNLGKLIASDADECVKGIAESTDYNCQETYLNLFNAGLLIRKDLFEQYITQIPIDDVSGEFYLTKIVKILHDAGYICRYLVCNDDEVVGGNSRYDLSELHCVFQNKMRNIALESGASLIDSGSVFFSYDTVVNQDVTIYPNVFLGVGVVLLSGTVVFPFSMIENCKILGSSIGPFARIRGGCTVGVGSKIGNFVEIKKSQIGDHSKINHLSYIGDCSMGNNCNIGAGTITCNYNGFEKFQTAIENEVFVGSNSTIVAPVKIEKGAIVAAGTTVVKDVNQDSMCISRKEQINIAGAAIRFKNKRKKCVE